MRHEVLADPPGSSKHQVRLDVERGRRWAGARDASTRGVLLTRQRLTAHVDLGSAQAGQTLPRVFLGKRIRDAVPRSSIGARHPPSDGGRRSVGQGITWGGVGVSVHEAAQPVDVRVPTLWALPAASQRSWERTLASAVRRIEADTVAVLACHQLDGPAPRRLAWELEATGVDVIVAPTLVDLAGPRPVHPARRAIHMLRVIVTTPGSSHVR